MVDPDEIADDTILIFQYLQHNPRSSAPRAATVMADSGPATPMTETDWERFAVRSVAGQTRKASRVARSVTKRPAAKSDLIDITGYMRDSWGKSVGSVLEGVDDTLQILPLCRTLECSATSGIQRVKECECGSFAGSNVLVSIT